MDSQIQDSIHPKQAIGGQDLAQAVLKRRPGEDGKPPAAMREAFQGPPKKKLKREMDAASVASKNSSEGSESTCGSTGVACDNKSEEPAVLTASAGSSASYTTNSNGQGTTDDNAAETNKPAGGGSPARGFHSNAGGRIRLPDKLMEYLSKEVLPDTLWWQEDGDGFSFDTAKIQTEFLDKYFRGTKLASFIRSLNRWGFRRIFYRSLPDHALSFHSVLFKKNEPHLVRDMKMVCYTTAAAAKKDKAKSPGGNSSGSTGIIPQAASGKTSPTVPGQLILPSVVATQQLQRQQQQACVQSIVHNFIGSGQQAQPHLHRAMSVQDLLHYPPVLQRIVASQQQQHATQVRMLQALLPELQSGAPAVTPTATSTTGALLDGLGAFQPYCPPPAPAAPTASTGLSLETLAAALAYSTNARNGGNSDTGITQELLMSHLQQQQTQTAAVAGGNPAILQLLQSAVQQQQQRQGQQQRQAFLLQLLSQNVQTQQIEGKAQDNPPNGTGGAPF